ncbi:hypothetical protein ID0623_01700 [Helicobacter pylori]
MENSPSVKFSKQLPITYKDIANYRDIIKNADETIKRDNRIISYNKPILNTNDYFNKDNQ